MIRRFLQDRLGLVAAFYINTALILLLAGLGLWYEGAAPGMLRSNLWYGALLATVVLALYLSLDYMRWLPFARQCQTLLRSYAGLPSLANLPSGNTLEQKEFQALLGKLYAQSISEIARYQDAHRRHLAFMNLWVHQMKTPVSAISLMSQQGAEATPEELRAALASVDEETVKLADGLDLVLNMARLQDFALDYQIRRTDLLTLVLQVINGRKKQFIWLSIFPEVEAEEGDWTVLTDEKWNRFVIDQVISNALKYASQAGRPGQKLKVSLRRHADRFALTIADQGPGIPPEDLPRIFDPFFTGENGRRYAQATGVGLYLVRQVLDQLGHEVQVESEPGHGTTVTLSYARS